MSLPNGTHGSMPWKPGDGLLEPSGDEGKEGQGVFSGNCIPKPGLGPGPAGSSNPKEQEVLRCGRQKAPGEPRHAQHRMSEDVRMISHATSQHPEDILPQFKKIWLKDPAENTPKPIREDPPQDLGFHRDKQKMVQEIFTPQRYKGTDEMSLDCRSGIGMQDCAMSSSKQSTGTGEMEAFQSSRPPSLTKPLKAVFVFLFTTIHNVLKNSKNSDRATTICTRTDQSDSTITGFQDSFLC